MIKLYYHSLLSLFFFSLEARIFHEIHFIYVSWRYHNNNYIKIWYDPTLHLYIISQVFVSIATLTSHMFFYHKLKVAIEKEFMKWIVYFVMKVDQCQVIGYEAKRKKESLNKSVIIDSESDSWKRRQERILYLDIN